MKTPWRKARAIEPAVSAPMLHIGVTPLTVRELRDAILSVLGTAAGDAVKIAAMQGLKDVVQVSNVSIVNCTFTGEHTGAAWDG